jgi:hypothetical protein
MPYEELFTLEYPEERKTARTGTYKVIISLGKRGIIVYNCRRRKEGEKAF